MLRLATYNVEWFDALFDDHGKLHDDAGPSARHGISRARQTAALGRVFAALEADAVLVVEAPDGSRRRDSAKALEGFAARFGLRCRRALTGFLNHTQQEIALLYDPDALSARHLPLEAGAPRFDGRFAYDLDTDAAPERVSFSKPPLEAELLTAAGRRLRLIGVHVKSKAPHGATTPEQVMRLSIANRRKQLAQCVWLRRRVEAQLEAGDDLVVLGDFNDGPGLDEYEKLFGRSGVEIVLGEPGPRGLHDPHARTALSRRVGAMPATARFYLKAEARYLQALLDFIMVSPGLRAAARGWRIWHPFDDAECFADPDLREALLAGSDHFPVTLDLDL
jgi:hypothetical protein